ncbi:Os11g0583366 [Oryza sativa Japonica Group]|uniref:Os11g0583366 protein n=3 Tax=Oryza TaxID=4527 RepID=Q2R214_ORYSJ|nr:hypothetical protein LOC_Os11g37360 [Oryza sativa Japonica Group]EAZ18855.1 hypothetical protein OsJ_34392 [Oryza sativa Japonica Group]BAT14620.1 Os11g0583366 [Oryza sativa Japonica Group]
MPAVADPALLGGVQDGLVLVILAARGMGQTVQTRGANGGRRRAGRAARGEEGTAASARMRHASCRTGCGRAAARMARRGRSVTAEALQDGVTAGATSDGGGGRFLGAVVGKCAAARGGGVTVGSGDRRGGGRFLGAQDPEHEVVIITAFCTAASPPEIRPHSDASFGVWVHPHCFTAARSVAPGARAAQPKQATAMAPPRLRSKLRAGA